ncbi:uncharacterized protein LOC108196894 isoform X2 [Daucus carota subsp. sativus]|uniref:uncharacterized protein LOC108196894 isoform X2 n=1 Tax=Daucus carota subsp. sativus TaxID=79200 RepID=UPI003083B809
MHNNPISTYHSTTYPVCPAVAVFRPTTTVAVSSSPPSLRFCTFSSFSSSRTSVEHIDCNAEVEGIWDFPNSGAATANVNAWSGAAMLTPLLGAFIAYLALSTIIVAPFLYVLFHLNHLKVGAYIIIQRAPYQEDEVARATRDISSEDV